MTSLQRCLTSIAGCFLTVMISPCSVAGKPPSSSKCRVFTKVVQPAGWDIPAHGKLVKSGPFKRAGFPEGITYTEFRIDSDQFYLPWYCEKEGELVLMSFGYRAETITQLDVKGATFAYFTFARGAEVGSAASVWWLDPDGSGKFTEFEWGSDGRVPDWVLKLR